MNEPDTSQIAYEIDLTPSTIRFVFEFQSRAEKTAEIGYTKAMLFIYVKRKEWWASFSTKCRPFRMELGWTF